MVVPKSFSAPASRDTFLQFHALIHKKSGKIALLENMQKKTEKNPAFFTTCLVYNERPTGFRDFCSQRLSWQLWNLTVDWLLPNASKFPTPSCVSFLRQKGRPRFSPPDSPIIQKLRSSGITWRHQLGRLVSWSTLTSKAFPSKNPRMMDAWNPKQPFINGCFNWMIPNLYIGNGCFTKHLFINGCLGFQVVNETKHLLNGSDLGVFQLKQLVP